MSTHFQECTTSPQHLIEGHRGEALELIKAIARPQDDVIYADFVPSIGTFGVIVSKSAVDYVVAVGLTQILKPGGEHLCWLANQLQKYALKGMFVDFDPQQWSTEDIIAAFGMRPRQDNTLVYKDGQYVVYFRL